MEMKSNLELLQWVVRGHNIPVTGWFINNFEIKDGWRVMSKTETLSDMRDLTIAVKVEELLRRDGYCYLQDLMHVVIAPGQEYFMLKYGERHTQV